jgi:hypothetical protein
MAAVLTSFISSSSSYFWSLEFLDPQSSFNATFPRPVPLLITNSLSGVSVDSTSVLSTLNRFLDSCKFHLFVPIFCSDYVGSSSYNDTTSLQASIQALKKHAMTRRNPITGNFTNLSPDELYAA